MIEITTLLEIYLQGKLSPKEIAVTLTALQLNGHKGVTKNALEKYRQAFAKLTFPREDVHRLWEALVNDASHEQITATVAPVSASACAALKDYIKKGYLSNSAKVKRRKHD